MMKSQKAIDDSIQSSTELLRIKDFYENGPDLFLSLDVADNVIRYCNQTTIRRLEYTSKNDLIGRHFLCLYHPDCHGRMEALYEKFRRLGKVLNEPVLLRTRTGHAIPARLSATGIQNDQGEVVASRSVLRNVSNSVGGAGTANPDPTQIRSNFLSEFLALQNSVQQLVHQERSVFEGVVQGQLNKQMARNLKLSDRTIERLKSRVAKKLNINSTAELIAIGSRFEVLQRLFADYATENINNG